MNYCIEDKKRLARQKINKIIRIWGIKKDKCMICGDSGDIEAHHPSYSRAYEIIFVCTKCRGKIHSGKIKVDDKNIINLKPYYYKSRTPRKRDDWRGHKKHKNIYFLTKR